MAFQKKGGKVFPACEGKEIMTYPIDLLGKPPAFKRSFLKRGEADERDFAHPVQGGKMLIQTRRVTGSTSGGEGVLTSVVSVSAPPWLEGAA